jgi:hypothetical protein
VSQAGPTRAVLNADIIYSRVLHELMGRVADDLCLLDLMRSEDLLAEIRQSLAEKTGLAVDVGPRPVSLYFGQSAPVQSMGDRSKR